MLIAMLVTVSTAITLSRLGLWRIAITLLLPRHYRSSRPLMCGCLGSRVLKSGVNLTQKWFDITRNQYDYSLHQSRYHPLPTPLGGKHQRTSKCEHVATHLSTWGPRNSLKRCRRAQHLDHTTTTTSDHEALVKTHARKWMRIPAKGSPTNPKPPYWASGSNISRINATAKD